MIAAKRQEDKDKEEEHRTDSHRKKRKDRELPQFAGRSFRAGESK